MKRMDDKNKCSLPHRFPFLFLRFVCCLCMCACASLSLSLFLLLSHFSFFFRNFSPEFPSSSPYSSLLPSNQHRPLPQGHLRPHSLPRPSSFRICGRVLCPSLSTLSPTGSASASLAPYFVHPFYLVQCAPRPVFRVSRSSLQQASLLLLWLCLCVCVALFFTTSPCRTGSGEGQFSVGCRGCRQPTTPSPLPSFPPADPQRRPLQPATRSYQFFTDFLLLLPRRRQASQVRENGERDRRRGRQKPGRGKARGQARRDARRDGSEWCPRREQARPQSAASCPIP